MANPFKGGVRQRGLANRPKGAHMTVQSPERVDNLTSRAVQEMANQLTNQLRRTFPRLGDQGTGTGIFSEIGRGDGSLHDSFREAEPDDELDSYHDILNALQPTTGPFYVHTHANRFERRGVFVPDIPASRQMGSTEAIYARWQVAVLTVELLVRTMLLLGHRPGLVLPGARSGIRIISPGTPEAGLLRPLAMTRSTDQPDGLEACLTAVERMSTNLEFAVVVSDFLSPGWEAKLRSIGRRIELLVFQIVDPWDLELPDYRRKARIQQGGKTVAVNLGSARVRRNFQKLVSRKQAAIAQAIKEARGQHYKLTTDGKPLIEQLLNIFSAQAFGRRMS